MNNEEKVSYKPSQTKRFEISHDPISRERITALTTTIKELRRKHPFVAGAILFGSLSKGKQLDENTADKSDVDFTIYLDTDRLTGDYSIHETFKRVFTHHNLEDFAAANNNDLEPLHYSSVALPWGLDVGGGMAKYRKTYLTQLLQLSKEERDLEWKVTARVIKFYERQGDISEGVKGQYPETFDEALSYYGIKAPQSKNK